MCFATPKQPSYTAPPIAAPTPVITPSEVSVQSAGDTRRKQLQALRYGLASTIKTSPLGVAGQGADLQAQTTGKTVLGA